MKVAIELRNSCARVAVRPGAALVGIAGSLWLVVEPMRPKRASIDVVLAAGERYRVDEPAVVYLTDLRHGGDARCEVDRGGEPAGRFAVVAATARDWLRPPEPPETAPRPVRLNRAAA